MPDSVKDGVVVKVQSGWLLASGVGESVDPNIIVAIVLSIDPNDWAST